MNRFTLAAVATVAAATAATAGGLDRSNQSTLAIFDPTGTLSFGLSHVNPHLSGVDVGGPGRYDAGGSFTTYSYSYVDTVNDRFSYAVIGDQPFGTDIFYDDAPTRSGLGGTTADIRSDAISVLGKYKVSDRISVFGGLRAQRTQSRIVLNGLAYQQALGSRAIGGALGAAAFDPAAPNQAAAQAVLGGLGANAAVALAGVATANPATAAVEAQLRGTGFTDAVNAAQTFAATGGYQVDLAEDWGVGTTIGAAYEIPEIALRLAITYQSEVTHDTTGTETSSIFGGTPRTSGLTFKTPQSVNIDFQTAVNPKTLVLASMRYANWGDFDVIPTLLATDLANIEDSHRWTLGVARRFTDQFVGLASLTYEKDRSRPTITPLGATDGQLGVSLGARYTSGSMNVSGGINYTKIGDAFAGVADRPVALFSGNSAVGLGLKVSYEF